MFSANINKKFSYNRKQIGDNVELTPILSSTRLILDEANKAGVDVYQIPNTKIFRLTYENKNKYFYHQIPIGNSAISKYICNDKYTTKMVLEENQISTPKGFSISNKDEKRRWVNIFKHLSKPLVIKPNKGSYGDHVTTDIDTLDNYLEIVKETMSQMKNSIKILVVEEMKVSWDEYRILATSKKVIGILKRDPANIVGDGETTIEKLIEQKNSDPKRMDPEDHPPLFKVQIDEKMNKFLAKGGRTLKSIPFIHEKIYLRQVSNITQGGDSIDFTDKVHDSVKEIALKTIRSIPGLDLGGVDFMTSDISKEQTPDTYSVLEVNDSPGIDIHDYPFIGENRRAGREFIRLMFPDLDV